MEVDSAVEIHSRERAALAASGSTFSNFPRTGHPLRTTSFNLSDSLYHTVDIAAASVGQCSSEYIRDALTEKLERHAAADPIIRLVVDGVADRIAQSREKVPA
jgi:predicted DNA-binding protein